MNARSHSVLFFLFQIAGALILLFILAPIAGLYFNSSFSQLEETIADSEVRQSIGLTLKVSMVTTILFAFVAIPFSYFLARKQFLLKPIILGIIDLPVVIPHSAAGIALLGVIAPHTFAGEAFERIGIDFIGNPQGIGIAMAFVSLPFLINAARDGFAAVPIKLEKAAFTLGASPLKVFFRISLPLAWKSILSGLVLMFARGMSEFGAVIIIAYHPMIAPVMIYERFGAFGLNASRPMAAVFVAVCLLAFVLLRILSNPRNNVKD